MADTEKLTCYIFGSGSLPLQCAEILLEKGHEIRGVFNQAPMSDWAKGKGIPTIDPDSDLAEQMGGEPFDYLFNITYLSIIPEAVLELPQLGAINFHDGPLPGYAGLNTPAWAILNQEDRYGITWHRMTKGIDEGDILKQKIFDIDEREVALTLNTKCFEAGMETFPELVDELAEDRVEARPQDFGNRSYFKKNQRPPAACVIQWDRPADEIAALVRALDFGAYENPLGAAKMLIGDRAFLVSKVQVLDEESSLAPGSMVRMEADSMILSTTDRNIAIKGLKTVEGEDLPLDGFPQEAREIGLLKPEQADRLTEINASVCKYEAYWVKKLTHLVPGSIPYCKATSDGEADRSQQGTDSLEFSLSGELLAGLQTLHAELPVSDLLVAAFGAFLARIGELAEFDVAYAHPSNRKLIQDHESLFASHVPVRLAFDPTQTFREGLPGLKKGLDATRRRQTYLLDTYARWPQLSDQRKMAHGGFPITIEITESTAVASGDTAVPFLFQIPESGATCRWVYDRASYQAGDLEAMRKQFLVFVGSLVQSPDQSVSEATLLSEDEKHQLLVEWNQTQTAFPSDACVHQLFEAQAAQIPDEVAVVFEDQSLTYRELNARSNQLAAHLRTLGVGPEVMVGVYVKRSLDLMIGIMGTLKAGGAYVPLDPEFPRDRIAFMIEDTEIPVLLTQEALNDELPPSSAQIVRLDSDWPAISEAETSNLDSGVTPANLAYAIYTSGSTGKPKGVLVEHHNVVNFFTGMDDRIDHDPPGVWLAVTSLSFDISVLELFYTLARGFKIVIYAEEDWDQEQAQAPGLKYTDKKLDFNFFYWNLASEDGDTNHDKYHLLLEGAKFADQHGFNAVWTPERHFHAFGGLYPNPSVTSAGLATITENIRIRAGSCVLPLHTPIRVAEEWSVVDNLSRGRVDIAFAAGWQPNDFVLRPENHADRKEIMFQDIEVVKKLWRGEAVDFPGPLGNDVSIRTLPRPIQAELNCWVTIAGNPESFEMAGRLGANVLTHLLGQTFEEVAEKIAIYRKARVEAGHPGEGTVTLMLHTFVGEDLDSVREIARGPMKNYLSSAAALVKQAAWHFPTFKKMSDDSGASLDEVYDNMSEEDHDALLDYAFERYFERSGLFGPPDRCIEIADQCKGVGVDEIACLIDYGIPSETVLKSLPLLKQVLDGANASVAADKPPAQAAPEFETRDYSIPALIERHEVSHLQCTPSMARMLVVNDETRRALGSLKEMMVGGEALPVSLANDLRALVPGKIVNMYGPTETTIWSSTYKLNGSVHSVPIGRPIANTDLYALDKNNQPVPVGLVGELYIGGEGVVRGYHNRPELTAERFVPHPFSDDPNARLYRTGDLVRYLSTGDLEILGRVDHQVKVRGYRIELGEIEERAVRHPNVREAVVVAREDDAAGLRLVAYTVLKSPESPLSLGELRDHLRESLPDYMVPSALVNLDTFPLTPNGKIDRKALPAPGDVQLVRETAYVAPENNLEQTVAAIWQEALNLPEVGIEDNFFDIGGHSILAVQVHAKIRKAIEGELSLTDIFRFPTIRSLAEFISNGSNGSEAQKKGQDRGEARKALMNRRRSRKKKGSITGGN